METTKNRIVDAAIATFIRYGARKTAMTDIAEAAGVSRQTLYDLFGNKNELIEAAISRNADLVLQRISDQLPGCRNLSEQLDVFFTETVIRSYEQLQTSEDVEDLISGHNDAGRAAIAVSRERYQKAAIGILKPHRQQIDYSGQTLNQLAAFLVQAAMGLKHLESRRTLNSMLHSLKTSVLLATDPQLVQSTTEKLTLAQS